MWLEIIIFSIIGIIAGTFTGLFPGIHINLVAASLLAFSVILLQYFSPLIIAVFVVSMAITHTFLDVLPAIFLGVPEEETALSVLPGHEMLLKGRGYEAVRLTVIGSIFGIFIIIFILPFYLYFLPKYYEFLSKIMAYILIAVSAFLILRDEKKFFAFFLFMLSGILGIFTLNFYAIKQPLFPLLGGLFGTSLLAISFMKKVKIPKQNFRIQRKVQGIPSVLFSSIISGALVSFLPGLGASQGAVIGSSITKLNRKSFLVLIGAISTITMGLGFVALYTISKPRHGAAVVVGKFLENFSLMHLLLFISIMLFVSGFAVFLTLALAKFFAKKIYKLNYSRISLVMIVFITLLSIIISGWYSLLILLIGTSIGILASILGIRKMHLMGCLIVPVILLFLL
ncbi:MAG: tripartite tricarboxylate transporter permease [Nanoarchaeota archaeon]|nr:tripartite tricarboxylate transporter permease [Nanoarchaeota archaeon]